MNDDELILFLTRKYFYTEKQLEHEKAMKEFFLKEYNKLKEKYEGGVENE